MTGRVLQISLRLTVRPSGGIAFVTLPQAILVVEERVSWAVEDMLLTFLQIGRKEPKSGVVPYEELPLGFNVNLRQCRIACQHILGKYFQG